MNLLCYAMRGGEDVDLRDEGAAAELPVAVEDRRHEGELVIPRQPSVHDVEGRQQRRRIVLQRRPGPSTGSGGRLRRPGGRLSRTGGHLEWPRVAVYDAARHGDDTRARQYLILVIVGIAPHDPETPVLKKDVPREWDVIQSKGLT